MLILTPMQAMILDFLERRDPPPTLSEIARHFGFTSRNTASRALYGLEQKRRILYDPAARTQSRKARVTVPLTADERAHFNLGTIDRCTACGHVIHTKRLQPERDSLSG